MAITRINIDDDTWELIYPDGPVLLAIWSIFGAFEEGLQIINQSFIVGPIFLGVYLIFMNIFLINLLIAIMNEAYSRIRKDDIDFKFYRYAVIEKYTTSSPLPPPLSILVFIKYIYCRNTKHEDTVKKETEVEKWENLAIFELLDKLREQSLIRTTMK